MSQGHGYDLPSGNGTQEPKHESQPAFLGFLLYSPPASAWQRSEHNCAVVPLVLIHVGLSPPRQPQTCSILAGHSGTRWSNS